LIAGDSALLPMSTRRRRPNSTSWSMVRSTPIWTASRSATCSNAGADEASIARWLPGPGDRCTSHHVVAHPPCQPHDEVVARGHRSQRRRLDGLDVAGAVGHNDDRPGGRVGAAVLGLTRLGFVGVEVVDDVSGLALDVAGDRVELDRVGEVVDVDEVDKHADAGHAKRQRPGDGQHRGTNACWPERCTQTVCSLAGRSAKAPTNTLKSSWVPRSRMKLRSSAAGTATKRSAGQRPSGRTPGR